MEPSVVKIAAEGTFIDPEVGEQRNSAGVGSGAIISDDGLIVTNNHVVTGAALLRVYLAGESEPVNAKVLGVSECSDLAVIQIDGEGYTALDYRTDEVTPGLEVYAAGFPASDANTSNATIGFFIVVLASPGSGKSSENRCPLIQVPVLSC